MNWASVDTGRLALSNRPKLKAVVGLASEGCRCIVTVQSGAEGALQVGRVVREAGLDWLWLPLGHGKPPDAEADRHLRAALPPLSARLDAGEAVMIHCSAGIHRTGMLAYGLLRWRGLSADEARAVLAVARPATLAGMRAEHFAWGDGVAGGG